MSGGDFIQKLIEAQGQSQKERLPEALKTHFVDVDERSTADYYEFLRKFSAVINFYQDDSKVPSDDWSAFFSFTEGDAQNWMDMLDDATPPQLALLQTFLELYRYPQQQINQLTERHLNFYYQDILKLQKKPARPDRAHLLVELKKNVSSVEITPALLFSAGKDENGSELLYTPTTTTVINQAQIASIRSLYWNKTLSDVVRYAPVANSADGLGESLLDGEPKWRGFGHDDLPVAETGFALASAVLRLKEGTRVIKAVFQLANIDPTRLSQMDLDDAFQVYLSGETSWLGPFIVTPVLEGAQLTFSFTLDAEVEAVIDYVPEIHGYRYTVNTPVMQVFLNEHTGYSQFYGIRLKTVQILVEVSGIRSLTLENDLGVLSPDKAFQPFGSQPEKGSRFLIGYREALEKKLSEIRITLDWKAAPDKFSEHYQNYELDNVIDNDYFTAQISFKDGGGWSVVNQPVKLFDSDHASNPKTITLSNDAGSYSATHFGNITQGLRLESGYWAEVLLSKMVLAKPVLITALNQTTKTRDGFISLELKTSFLHECYRQQLIKNTLEFAVSNDSDKELTLLNEPYTPTIRSIQLSYKASSDIVDVTAATLERFTQDDIQFYHLACFGHRREHGYLRQLFDFVRDKNIPLLYQYSYQGELLIGLENLQPGDSVSVLFRMAEGSAAPDLPRQTIQWSVLCDNYWRALTSQQVLQDTTNQLLTSGLIKFILPTEATTENTLMPSGFIWLKAAVVDQVEAVCQFISIAANAIEVVFVDQGQTAEHLLKPLPAGRIGKLKKPLAQIKKISQPYASFGYTPQESQTDFYTRVSERLRHKDRALTIWDTERLVLANFPNIQRVKCIPHAKPGSWQAPGHVQVIVVADLRNNNAVNPLQPRVDSDTLSEIQQFLQRRNSQQMEYHIVNPRYQPVQLSFKVQFRPGYEFNYYQTVLQQKIIEYLSPWAFAQDKEIHFGGRIMAAVLVDYIEDTEFVDFITDFSFVGFIDEQSIQPDNQVIQPVSPDVILVSAQSHLISAYQVGG
jgi:hypothetical protein